MWRAAGLAFAALVAAGCGASNSGNGCSASAFTCGMVLTGAQLTQMQPDAAAYVESGKLPCMWSLPSSSGGILQVFCGDADLLARQRATGEGAYPGSTTETDTVGMKSFEMIVGPPMSTGSYAEVDALTSNGKYVFNVSLTNAAADITAVRPLADAIDANLSAL
jgi:hypothetical protein